MTGPRWKVVELDRDGVVIAVWRHVDEAEARELFDYVATERSQRSDVVQRARSAALVHDGRVVDGREIAPTRRAPWIGDQRLRNLDATSRELVHDLELHAGRLVLAALRLDGAPRVDPVWSRVRAVACALLDTVRGHTSTGPDEGGWWLVEWTCGDHQAERTRAALHATCPYHDTRAEHGPVLVDR